MDLSSNWLETVRRVMADVSGSDVSELELAHGSFRLRLRRRVRASSTFDRSGEAAVEREGVLVVAPLTGVFYRAPSPTAELFCREGDWVDVGATVGLIETMKIFNEVKTELAGIVQKILVESGQLVQAGDPLMALGPGERLGGGGEELA